MLKNIYALAVGISNGLGYGDNYHVEIINVGFGIDDPKYSDYKEKDVSRVCF